MARREREFSIRSFQEGDEEAFARLFNRYIAGSFGPIRVTPKSWRGQFERQGWNGPSVTADKDCTRVVERGGEVIGYAVTDYKPFWRSRAAVIQELCVAAEESCQAVMEALIEDGERRARERGKSFIMIELPPEDARARAAATARGYDWREEAEGVFMVAVTDISGFLGEIANELSHRLRESEFRGWRGTVRFASGEQSATLKVDNSEVRSTKGGQAPDISVTVHSEVLPLLLTGRRSVGELYLQDTLSLTAANREEALRLLDVLLPRLPIFLPRAQWW